MAPSSALALAIGAGDLLAEKYRVEQLLGEGGMGIVVAAWHLEREERVAIKFLKPSLAERRDVAERFRREARALERIKSDHVARVFEVGTTEAGAPYMVMEFLKGQDLAAELEERGRLPVGEAVAYIAQAIEAVAEAHAAGIVHRDLKPANLFLVDLPDGARFLKVLDFGISKSLGGSMVGGSIEDVSITKTSTLIGSPMYMSPEQMRSAKAVDERTDIWALGAILYHLLAGSPPYPADTIAVLCSALLNENPKPLSTFRADIPAELEQAILRCLQKDRRFRFATVAEFAEALVYFGPPEVKGHAERAARIVGMMEVSVEVASVIDPPVDTLIEPPLGSSHISIGLEAPTVPDPVPDSRVARRSFPASSRTQPSIYKPPDPPKDPEPSANSPVATEAKRPAPSVMPRLMLVALVVLSGAGWLAYAFK